MDSISVAASSQISNGPKSIKQVQIRSNLIIQCAECVLVLDKYTAQREQAKYRAWRPPAQCWKSSANFHSFILFFSNTMPKDGIIKKKKKKILCPVNMQTVAWNISDVPVHFCPCQTGWLWSVSLRLMSIHQFCYRTATAASLCRKHPISPFNMEADAVQYQRRYSPGSMIASVHTL